MADRVSFSGLNLKLSEIAAHYNDVEASLRGYFNPVSPTYSKRFESYIIQEVEKELETRLSEQRQSTILTILSSVEAAFRIDYHLRCERKKRIPYQGIFLNFIIIIARKKHGLLLRTKSFLYGKSILIRRSR